MLFVFFDLYEQEYQRFTDELYFWHSIVIFFYNALVTPLYMLSEYLPMDAIFSIGFLVITLCFPVLLFISGCNIILKGLFISGCNIILKGTCNSSENKKKWSKACTYLILFSYSVPLFLLILLAIIIEIGISLYIIPMELYQNWSWFCYELINSI